MLVSHTFFLVEDVNFFPSQPNHNTSSKLGRESHNGIFFLKMSFKKNVGEKHSSCTCKHAWQSADRVCEMGNVFLRCFGHLEMVLKMFGAGLRTDAAI